jgi:predicted O-methyltransferase YrrM
MNLNYEVTDNDIAYTYVNNVKGCLNKMDTMVLLEHYKNLPFNSKYVEIGSYLGCSTVLAGLTVKNKSSLVYAHDIWEENMNNLKIEGGPPPTEDNYLYQFYENIRNNNLEGIVIPMRGDSSYTVGIHEDNSIDLAFVDGDHSYEGVLRDLTSIYPKMKSDSIILCHDATQDSKVLKSITEFCNRKKLEDVREYKGSSIASIHIKESYLRDANFDHELN